MNTAFITTYIGEKKMPMTTKGEKIMRAMKKTYGKDAKKVFYASKNKGTIKGVDKPKRKKVLG